VLGFILTMKVIGLNLVDYRESVVASTGMLPSLRTVTQTSEAWLSPREKAACKVIRLVFSKS